MIYDLCMLMFVSESRIYRHLEDQCVLGRLLVRAASRIICAHCIFTITQRKLLGCLVLLPNELKKRRRGTVDRMDRQYQVRGMKVKSYLGMKRSLSSHNSIILERNRLTV